MQFKMVTKTQIPSTLSQFMIVINTRKVNLFEKNVDNSSMTILGMHPEFCMLPINQTNHRMVQILINSGKWKDKGLRKMYM